MKDTYKVVAMGGPESQRTLGTDILYGTSRKVHVASILMKIQVVKAGGVLVRYNTSM